VAGTTSARYALHRYGLDGLRNRVRYARDMAAYTVEQLNRIGWPSTRHPHAMTVVLDPPPADIATLDWSPVSCATTVLDPAGLSKLIHVPTEQILESVTWFEHPDGTMLSPRGTLLIAEAACRATPMLVLDLVAEQEAVSRHKCKHGADGVSVLTREKERTLPEEEYDRYRRFDRPRFELLRQWCGHRAITVHERLLAAEAENERLDVLVSELIRALAEAGDKKRAKSFAEEHECERITPESIRPIVDRPLHPSEIPVREVRVRRSWW
jgi:hypothetical protein